METLMSIMLYELVGRDDLRFSPYCWRTRFALAHKGLRFETVPVRFTDKQKIAFSGQERVPVIRDGGAVVHDSWTIACYLDEAYPDRPPLFASGTERAMARFFNSWADLTVNPRFILLVVKDVYDNIDAADRPYFLETREKRFGTTIDALHAARGERLPAARDALAPVRALLADQPFIAGDAPGYADYILMGTCQWVRIVGTCRIIEPDDPVHEWRARMLALFDGMAADVPALGP